MIINLIASEFMTITGLHSLQLHVKKLLSCMYPLNIVPDQLFPFGFEKIRKILIKVRKTKAK